MTNLAPRDRFFEDLFDFRRNFDEMFNRIFLGKSTMSEPMPRALGFAPPMESYVEKGNKKFVCRVYLPGVAPSEVEVLANGNVVTIKGERRVTPRSKEASPIHEEVIYGAFERSFELPEGVLPEKLAAEYSDGVIEITAPVTEAALPRKIEIKTVPLAKRAAA